MGNVLKIGNNYYIEFYARGLRYQRNGGPDKKIARQLLKEIEAQIQKGEMSTVVPDVETSAFLKTVLDIIRAEYSPKTISRYETVIWHFQDYCCTSLSENSKLSQVTPSVIEGYRAFLLKETGSTNRVIKPKLVNFTLYLLKDILDYSISLGSLNDNPTLHTRFVEVPHQRIPQTLSEKDIKGLLTHASHELKDIVLLLLRTGISVEELIQLKWTNVDIKDNNFKIKQSQGERRIPMIEETVIILQRLKSENVNNREYVFAAPPGQPLTKSQLTNDCARLAEKIGISSTAIFYIFRHTFAKNVLKKGVSLAGLYKLLGLNDIARVMCYAGFVQGLTIDTQR